jgi:hypothetical protein
MHYLVSTSELERTIEALMDAQNALDFPREVPATVQALVNQYNLSEADNLIAVVIELFGARLDDYSPIDHIVACFQRLVAPFAQHQMDTMELEYDAGSETIIVTPRPRSLPDPVSRIKEEYQHARTQGDFYPERLRRAFDELSSGL